MGSVKNILISGGTGLIGARLTGLLLERGDRVSHLSREKKISSSIPVYLWDIDSQTIDPEALQDKDVIIHLAGAGVGDKYWTSKRKHEILNSRIQSTRLLCNKLKNQKHSVKTFISASGSGYYGYAPGNVEFTEDSPPGNDFLAEVTRQWEQEADAISATGIRVVKLRIGVVLSNKGGALKKLAAPVRYFAGAVLGSGGQYMSWIHIDDLCNIIIKAIDNTSLQGVYNAVAPHPVTNREVTEALAKALHRPLILPAVPGMLLKILFGEMSEMVLNGSKVSGEKIRKTGYSFRFNNVGDAVKDLFCS